MTAVAIMLSGWLVLAGNAGMRPLLVLEPSAENPRNSEGDIIELKDGRLCLIYTRFTGGAGDDAAADLAMRTSRDGGDTWSKAGPSALASPLSPASLARIPWTGDLLCVWNDHSGVHSYPAGRRTPLCLAVSGDEGQTWSKSTVIEGNPDGWYCYTAIAFVEDRMLLAYCAGNKTVGGLNRLKVLGISKDRLASYPPKK